MMALAWSAVTGSPVGIADHVGHPTVHHRPGPLAQVGRHHTQSAKVVLAPLHHLHVVDAGQLGIDFGALSAARTSVVRSSDEPALDMGWALPSPSGSEGGSAPSSKPEATSPCSSQCSG